MVVPVDLGTAELVADPHRIGAWTLLVEGVAQSYVDLADPMHLEFEYVRRLASIVDAVAPDGAALDVLHLGGGAFTLPRYVAATRPHSAQEVIERDGKLAELVQRELPLPDTDVVVRITDARAGLEETDDERFDLVIGDVYRAAQMPRNVTSVEFAAQVARVLRPDGWYAVNVADLPPLAFSRVQAATLRVAFADVCVLAEPAMLRGRRYGNVVLAAARRSGGLPIARLATAAARDPFPSRMVHGASLDRFCAGAGPVTDEAATDSPRALPRRVV